VTVVVDASLAFKWAFEEELTDRALALWDSWQHAAERLIAPPTFRAEVINAAHQRVRLRQNTLLDAIESTDLLLEAVAIEEPRGLYRRALDLASAYSLGATYDALYLALADAYGCPVVTADRRFARAVKGAPVEVRWLGGPA
jgi:predicted nucleic acid-binding protein